MRPANVFVAGATRDTLAAILASGCDGDVAATRWAKVVSCADGTLTISNSDGDDPDFAGYDVDVSVFTGDDDSAAAMLRKIVELAGAIGLRAIGVFNYEPEYMVACTPAAAE